jgi:hypothetical protein
VAVSLCRFCPGLGRSCFCCAGSGILELALELASQISCFPGPQMRGTGGTQGWAPGSSRCGRAGFLVLLPVRGISMPEMPNSREDHRQSQPVGGCNYVLILD